MTDMPVQQRRMSGALSYLSPVHIFPNATVLRSALDHGPAGAWSDRGLFPLGGTVAREAVPAQNVGVHRFRPADSQQPPLRLYDRAAPSKVGGLPEQCQFSRIVLWISTTIYAVGVFSAFMFGAATKCTLGRSDLVTELTG
jgi:hypothetical protein